VLGPLPLVAFRIDVPAIDDKEAEMD
jgi:hypothetical protein